MEIENTFLQDLTSFGKEDIQIGYGKVFGFLFGKILNMS